MHGTIYSVASMIRTVTHEGDGVIVQSPVYPRYEQAVRRLSRRIVYNPLICENGRYTMDLNDLEDRMKDPDNRLLVICNPHNPVGRVWTEEELKGVAFLSHKYAKHVISDEIFAEIAFDGRRTVPYISVPGAEEYGAVITSLGKTFNFTGVNHANVIITDPELRDRYIERKYADHYGSVGPFEYASIRGAYCEEGKRWMEAMRDHLQKIRDRLAAGLEDIFPGICISPAEGSSVKWMDLSRILGDDPAEVLMNKALVQTESGTDFSPGGEGSLRWCFSTSGEQIDDALSRLHAVFKEGKDVP
jgi:cystathionine beta-lyase